MNAQMTSVLKSIALSTGVTLPYAEQGSPAGSIVIFLHGYSDSWHTYELLLPHLPASIHAFAITQRGHGDAERPASGYGPRDFGSDLAAFMDALDIESAIIVGHSMSTSIIQRFALEHPDRVTGLVMIGAFKNWADNPVAVDLWESGMSQLDDPVDPEFVREFQESTFALPIPEPFLNTIIEESSKVPAHVWRTTFKSFLEAEIASELHRISAPTLIAWGDQDVICARADQEWLAATIPGARLLTYEGVGHTPHWEIPERFAGDLVGFVEGLGQ